MVAAARMLRVMLITHAARMRKRSSRAGAFGSAQRGTSKRARKSPTTMAKSTLKESSKTSVVSVRSASRDLIRIRPSELQERSAPPSRNLEHSLKPPLKDKFETIGRGGSYLPFG